MNTTTETEGGAPPAGERAGPASRIRRLPVRLLAAILAIGLAAAGGLWMSSLPPGTGVLAGLRDAGVPVPERVMGLLEPLPGGGGRSDAQPVPDAVTAETLPALPPDAAPQVSGTDELAAAIERVEAGLAESLDAVRSDLVGQRNAVSELSGEVERLSGLLSGFGEERSAEASLLRQTREEAAQALREARHARNLIEGQSDDRDARLGLIEEDVQAFAASLRNLRHMQAAVSDRIEAVASDLHLLLRFGDGTGVGDAGAAGPASTTTTAPWRSNYHSTADAAAGEPRVAPESLVQGQYRVGDWVAGWGVVTAIRRTPDGDHLTTPRGTLFAPAAPSAAGE